MSISQSHIQYISDIRYQISLFDSATIHQSSNLNEHTSHPIVRVVNSILNRLPTHRCVFLLLEERRPSPLHRSGKSLVAKEGALQGSLPLLNNFYDLSDFLKHEVTITYHEYYRIPGFSPSHQWKGMRLNNKEVASYVMFQAVTCCLLLGKSTLWVSMCQCLETKTPRQSTNDRMPSSATGLRWGLLERCLRLIMVEPMVHILFCLERTWKSDLKFLEDCLVYWRPGHI